MGMGQFCDVFRVLISGSVPSEPRVEQREDVKGVIVTGSLGD